MRPSRAANRKKGFLRPTFIRPGRPAPPRRVRLSVLAEREASSTQAPEGEGVKLRRTADGKGDGVMATRPFAAGETVMVGFLIGALTGNDSHATQVGPGRWALHGGLGPKVNHSCDPNCGVRLNNGQAFDFVARQPIAVGQELTFDYAMRNFTIDHFPAVCLCGAVRCRGSVTGWKDLPAARKAREGMRPEKGTVSTVVRARPGDLDRQQVSHVPLSLGNDEPLPRATRRRPVVPI